MRDQLPPALLRLGVHDEADKRWVVVAGDAVNVMASMPAGAVDVVFADPPYFLSDGGSTNRGGARISVDKGDWDSPTGVDDQHEFHRRWTRAARRVLAPTGTIWVSGTHHVAYSIGWALQRDGWEVLNCVVRQDPAPPPNLGCRCLTHSVELVTWARPYVGAPHVFDYAAMKRMNGGKQMKDVWTIGRPRVAETSQGRHSTQKPRELLRRIITASTTPGGIVLEPFAGSGTGGVAALALGRRWVGIDSDPEAQRLAVANLRGMS